MKKHIRIKGTKYYLCGLKGEVQYTPDLYATECMQCGYIAGGLLGVRHDSKEFHDAVRKLKRRG